MYSVSTSPGRTVYPRWRGEHQYLNPGRCVYPGLSPLARGTHDEDEAAGSNKRFIPAGAGNTLSVIIGRTAVPVYPRWRGEHGFAHMYNQYMSGLSPLARGTPTQPVRPGFNLRFIPAGAGNTDITALLAERGAVYPRWRGEHAKTLRASVITGGLSPLARGTQRWLQAAGIY